MLVGLGGEFAGLVRTSQINEDINAALTKDAGDAKISARNAADEAQRAKNAAQGAVDKAAEAKTAADVAAGVAQQANGLAGAAQRKSSEAETLANSAGDKARSVERQADVIQKGLLPRHFNQNATIVDLREFAGTPVIMESLTEFEPRNAMQMLEYVLDKAGWNVLSAVPVFDPPSEFGFGGIMVEVGWRHAPVSQEVFQAPNRAALTLVNELKIYGVDADFRAAGDDLAPGVVRIRVALKPMPGEPKVNIVVERTRE